MIRVCEFCESHCLKLTSLTRHRSRFRQNCRSTSKRSWMRSIGRKTSLQQQMLPLHRVPRRLGGTLFHRVQTKVLVSWPRVFQELFLSWIILDSFCSIFMYFLRNWQAVELEQEIDTATKERQMRDNFSAKHVLPSSSLLRS